MIERLLHDVQLACRGLWRAKAFSLAAVATLGIGTSGATVILALWQGVLLRPLPVHDQQGLVVVWRSLPPSHDQHYPFGDREIAAVRDASRTLEDVAGVATNGLARWVALDESVATYVNGALVTGRFFDVLGVQPLMGRTLQDADDRDGSEPVVVISAGFWHRRYGGAPEVLGRRITLDEQSFTIVGVMPADLDYPRGAEAWRATRSVPISPTFGDAARQEVDMIGRLRPGLTPAQAASELTAMSPQLDAIAPAGAPRGFSTVVRPFEEVVTGAARPALLALLIAVGIVLLIASANVANLLLMRGESRRGELAIRSALGAGRWRIIRQLLLESAALSVLAMLLGLVVTWWSLQWLITIVPEGLPRIETVRVDAVVVLFVAGVAVVTSLLAGVVPALLSARTDIVSQLRMGARGVTDAATGRGRRGLVVAQVALAVTVVAVGRAADTDHGAPAIGEHGDRLGPAGLREPVDASGQAGRSTETRAVPRGRDRVVTGDSWNRGGDPSERAAVRGWLERPGVRRRGANPGAGRVQPLARTRVGALQLLRCDGRADRRRPNLHVRRPRRRRGRGHYQRRRRGPHLARNECDRQAPQDGWGRLSGQLAHSRRRRGFDPLPRSRQAAGHALPAGGAVHRRGADHSR